MVEYTPGYLADHWCEKGHVLLCLEGELLTELADGRTFTLIPGMSYQVADGGAAASLEHERRSEAVRGRLSAPRGGPVATTGESAPGRTTSSARSTPTADRSAPAPASASRYLASCRQYATSLLPSGSRK